MNQGENKFQEQGQDRSQEEWNANDKHPGCFSSNSNMIFPDDTEVLHTNKTEGETMKTVPPTFPSHWSPDPFPLPSLCRFAGPTSRRPSRGGKSAGYGWSSVRLRASGTDHWQTKTFGFSLWWISTHRNHVLVSVSLSTVIPCESVGEVLFFIRNAETFLCDGFLALLFTWYLCMVLWSSLDNEDGETLLRFLLDRLIEITFFSGCFYLRPAQKSCQKRMTRLQGPMARQAWFMNEKMWQNCKVAVGII